ncbi:MAG: hypothetical protein WAZ27_05105 [Minisyncoccia bacterium]
MKRIDWYILALGVLQVSLLFHIISIIKTGSVISMTGQANFDGYLATFLLAASVLAPLKNLSRLIISVTRNHDADDSAALADITSVGRWTLAGIVAIIALEFVQSLALLNLYSAGY